VGQLKELYGAIDKLVLALAGPSDRAIVQIVSLHEPMTVDHIRYDILTQDALRNVVRTVLEDAARNGLPGEHHFYVAFDTRSEGVKLSQRMRAQYPEEMTVVLQHQFWDLVVTDEQFEVGLSFGGVPERVVVPFAAIKSFVDPSVQFGVQFETLVATDDESRNRADAGDAGEQSPPAPAAPTSVTAVPTPANPPAADQPPEDANAEPDAQAGSAQVVSLDRFRKK
jgi:hypothetical protein